MLPRVLVAIPIFEDKDYIFNENFEAIKSFDYKNYDYIYIDNSRSPHYARKLRRRGANVVRVPRGENSRQALCNAQNYARSKVLKEGYDYLMFVESDLIPPQDALRRLLNHNKQVIGATYLIGHEHKVPCAFVMDYKPETGQMGTRLVGTRTRGTQVIGLDDNEVQRFLNNGVQQVHGMGLGCTLIRADIIKRYPFWYDGRFDNKHSDVYFYMDLHNDNIPVYLDTDFMIPHFPSKWENVKDR